MLTNIHPLLSSSIPSNISFDPNFVSTQPVISLDQVLLSLQNDGKAVFSPSEVKELILIKYKDTNQSIVTLEDRKTIYNIYGMMISEPKPDFKQLVSILINCKTPNDIIWDYPQLMFARSTEVLKNNFQQGTFQISESKMYCYRCKSKQAVNITYSQIRRTDEPMTEFIRCTNCEARL